MRHKFDKGNIIEDLKAIYEDAKKKTPALIVVPTEREVRAFERNIKDDSDEHLVWCCSFANYHDGSWVMIKPRPKHIFIFRYPEIFKNISADATVEYVTSVGKKNFKKEENTNEEA